MYAIDFICKSGECNHIIYNQIYANYECCPQNITCPLCGDTMIKTWTVAPPMIINEGQGIESSKEGSYWRNAEAVKQDAIAKRQKIEKEKIVYKDKEAVRKQEIKQRNTDDE